MSEAFKGIDESSKFKLAFSFYICLWLGQFLRAMKDSLSTYRCFSLPSSLAGIAALESLRIKETQSRTMHSTKYQAILADNMVASTKRLRLDCTWTFQQDNNPSIIHTEIFL